MEQLKAGIIGMGKLGSALLQEYSRHSLIKWVVSGKSNLNLPEDVKFLNPDKLLPVNSVNFILLCVPDRSIEEVAESFSIKYHDKLKGKTIVHFSGAHGRKLLDFVENYGAKPVAAHPYQTFFYYTDSVFRDVPWGVDADETGFKPISEFIALSGGKAINISHFTPGQRALYHASAVAASNFLTAVTALGAELAINIGISPDDFLSKIIMTSAENTIRNISEDRGPALTGPIARGDENTLGRHLKAMENYPELFSAYKKYAEATTGLDRYFRTKDS